MEQTKNKQSLLFKLLPISLCLAIIILDQLTKCLIVAFLPRTNPVTGEGVINVIGDFFRIIHVRNPAVAFSIGHNLPFTARKILFSIIPLIVIILVFVIYFRNNDFTKLQRWSISGILGGGLGNLIDRFFRPAGVVDFLDFKWFGLTNSKINFLSWERWPTFNVADMGVVICGIIFVISFIVIVARDSKKQKAEKKENS